MTRGGLPLYKGFGADGFKWVAPLPVDMHPEMRAEMAQEYHREMDNMRAARQDTPSPEWDVAALDAEGEPMFVTESEWSEERAEEVAADINSMGDSNYPDGVEKYAVVKRENHNL